MSSRPFTADIEDLALGELGLSTSQVDVLGSAALRKCPGVWSKEDNGWKRGWIGDLWDLLYIHVARGSLKRVVARIARDSAQAVLIIPSWEIKEAKDAPWVQDLRCMTLIATQLPAAEDIFVDAQGNPLPPPAKGPSTTVPWVDWSLAHPARDMGTFSIRARVQREKFTIVDRPDRSISRIMALPVRFREETADRWYCPLAMAQDALLPDELDTVCGYMSSPMHLGVPSKGPPAKSWWEDPALRTGRFTKNEFKVSVSEHWADQDERAVVQAHTTRPPTTARSKWSPKFSRCSHDPQRQRPRDVGARPRDARSQACGGQFSGQRARGGQVDGGPPQVQGQDGGDLQGLW